MGGGLNRESIVGRLSHLPCLHDATSVVETRGARVTISVRRNDRLNDADLQIRAWFRHGSPQ